MAKEGSTLPGSGHAGYAYPRDLARFVRRWWDDAPEASAAAPLPDEPVLEELFSACYQASLLREEERAITFRVILAEPDLFLPEGGPPEGLHNLEFSHSRAFNPREIRRLSVAADFHRSLMGARLDEELGLRIWGMIHSGPRWLRDIRGGRRAGAPLPPAPVVHVGAPGSIEVRKGHELVGKLEGGVLWRSQADPFDSQWLPAEFSGLLEGLLERHAAARDRALKFSGERWAPLRTGLERQVAERMLKRVVSIVSDARHGGTVVFVPSEEAGELFGENPYIDIKYPFAEGRPRHRFRDLIVGILNRLAQLHSTDDHTPEPVGWEEFEKTTDPEIATLDESLFEVAYLISSLAAADGAVVMSKHHELLGFGGEISGALPAVRTVARALDLEGEMVVEDTIEDLGTRHRSAYRLANALEGAVVIVISQDGGVRFISRKNGRLTYWDQQ